MHNSDISFFGAFVIWLGTSTSFIVELSDAMFAIEFALKNRWNYHWMKTNSTTVVKDFNYFFLK